MTEEKQARTLAFGRKIQAGRRAKRLSAAKLGALLGQHDPELALGDTEVRRIEAGMRRNLPPELIARLIEVLELDPVKTWQETYPEIVEAVLTAVGGDRPTRAAGAGVGRPADQASGTNRNTSPFVVPIGRAA